MKTHVHDNSKAVYWSPETQSAFTARERLILDALSQMGSATHRQLQQFLDFTDLGMCQPRCSDLVRKGAIEECGRVRCEFTGNTVRLLRLRTAEHRDQLEMAI